MKNMQLSKTEKADEKIYESLANEDERRLSKRLCLIGTFRSPTFSGRILNSLLKVFKKMELELAASERFLYGYQPKFELSRFAKKLLKRPESGFYRLWAAPLEDLPPGVDKGAFWAFPGFDTSFADLTAIKKLRKADFVFLTSDAQAQICVQNGIKPSKIHVFHNLPVDRKIFKNNLPQPAGYEKEKGVFRFIISAHPLKRKGVELVLESYLKEFKNTEKVELVIKLPRMPRAKKDLRFEIEDFAQKIGALNRMFAKVTVINEVLSDEEYGRLLSSADAYIAGNIKFNSGINAFEAAACGLPVIAPSNITDFVPFEEGDFLSVETEKFKFEPGELYINSPKSYGKAMNKEALQAAMRKAFAESTQVRKIGLKAQRNLKKLKPATWGEMAEIIASRVYRKLLFQSLLEKK
ncbi:MAG: glycosyltransferase family 4 protein [Candidatus Riflebacteria bacterium]|nr:glycosyltransferase family 4 protein [Candidatus Riflebacteria bacterium]